MSEIINKYKRNAIIDTGIGFLFLVVGIVIQDAFYYMMSVLCIGVAFVNIIRYLKLKKTQNNK